MRDIRSATAYRELEAWFQATQRPGGGVTQGTQTHPSPGGQLLTFTGVRRDHLAGPATTVICVAATAGDMREVSASPRDQLPRRSPEGQLLGYLSDRRRPPPCTRSPRQRGS